MFLIWLLDAGKLMGISNIKTVEDFLFKIMIDIYRKNNKDKRKQLGYKRSQRLINEFYNIGYVYENLSNRKTLIGVSIGAISMELLKELIVKMINRTINILYAIDNSMVNLNDVQINLKLESLIKRYIYLLKNNIKSMFENLYIIPTHGVISNSVTIFEIVSVLFKKFFGYPIEKTKNSYDVYVGIVVRG